MSPPRIWLASQSPRRQELLRQLGVDFEMLKLREAPGRERDVVEEAADGEPPRHYVERIARTKAHVGWERIQRRKLELRPVLGADTEVTLDGTIFGKPTDAQHAVAMLERLSGRTHEVMTAVAVQWHEETALAISISQVTFRPLARAEIERYVATGEPSDKAGAYAIQGRAAAFIAALDGSHSGVMGLPLYETAEVLARIGHPVL